MSVLIHTNCESLVSKTLNLRSYLRFPKVFIEQAEQEPMSPSLPPAFFSWPFGRSRRPIVHRRSPVGEEPSYSTTVEHMYRHMAVGPDRLRA